MHPAFSVLIGGILPFGAVFIELFFILTSMWLHQFYYLFGFLCLVFVILIITCAEITIVLCLLPALLRGLPLVVRPSAFPCRPGLLLCRTTMLCTTVIDHGKQQFIAFESVWPPVEQLFP